MPHGTGQLGEAVSINQGAFPPVVVFLVPPLGLPSGDASDERPDGRIGSRIRVGVFALGSLDRPERRQGRDVAYYRRLADGLRLIVVSSARFLFWPRLWRLMTSVARKATSLSAVTVLPSWNPRVSVAQAYILPVSVCCPP